VAKSNGRWQGANETDELRKRPKLQGPIDDAFLGPVLVVLPSVAPKHPRVAQWVDFEAKHLLERWQAAFRGELKVVQADAVEAKDLVGTSVVLWGDPGSNSWIARFLEEKNLPLKWDEKTLKLGKHELNAATLVPALIYPSPFDPARYVVINSGPTFREAHDRTNSLQNPKLPDWALLDITTPPDGAQPGKIVAADFFDEAWQVKSTAR
jgi:hypothetical protein